MGRSSGAKTSGPRRPARLLTGLTLVCLGCAGNTVDVSGVDDIGWPPGDHRVRLQSIVRLGTAAHGPRSAATRRLWGETRSPAFRRPYAVAWDGSDLLVADPDSARVARIGASGRLTLSPAELFQQPADIAVCPSGILVTDAMAGRVAVLGPDLYLRKWLAKDVVRPTGIACENGRTFVVETGNHRIVSFTDDLPGATLGSRGTEPGRFNFPTSLTMHDGTLLVGDALNFRIQQIDPDTGQAIAVFGQLGDSPGEMPRLKGIAVDHLGQVWVADAHLDQVSLYRLDGKLLLSFGGTGGRPDQFSFPAGIAANADGRVAVVDSLNLRVKLFRVVERSSSKNT